MIEFEKVETFLLLKYYSESQPNDTSWLDKKLDSGKSYHLKNIFRVNDDILYDKIEPNEEYDGTEYQFIIGDLEEEYYKLNKTVFGLKNEFYLHESIELYETHFVAKVKISILKHIDSNLSQTVYIGGTKEDILPIQEFEKLIDIFPTSYEIKKYREARVTSIISNYFESVKDSESVYKKYINKKSISLDDKLRKTFKDSEVIKYETILEKIKLMLDNEVSYSENQWQDEIIQIILLLFPKYISAFKEVRFKDIYNNKTRRLDYGLIDYMGNLDLVEIKIPFDKNIVSKNTYRDNHFPNRELSGTIMQIEKYIFYLNKTGKKGEIELTKKYKDELPEDIEIRITNPNGIIIMGRDKYLDESQKSDFEIIKRKYKNIIDIFTYDDLIRRMEIILKQLKNI